MVRIWIDCDLLSMLVVCSCSLPTPEFEQFLWSRFGINAESAEEDFWVLVPDALLGKVRGTLNMLNRCFVLQNLKQKADSYFQNTKSTFCPTLVRV